MQIAFPTYPKDDFVRPEQKVQEKKVQPDREIKNKTDDTTVQTDTSTQKLQELPNQGNVSLKFKQDQDTGRLVVEMIDDTTGNSIRQIPTEASLRFSAVIGKIQAKFVDKQV